jgi:hypothetical protein
LPDTHESSNERVAIWAFKLWKLWKQGNLKILDGHDVSLGGEAKV